MNKIIFGIVLAGLMASGFVAPLSLSAMTGTAYMKNIRANYEELNNFQVQIAYTLYKGHDGDEVIESYTSSYAKSDELVYRSIGGTEYINGENYFLNVNHAQQVIIISDKSNLELLEGDLNTSLEMCRDVVVNTGTENDVITLFIKNETDLPYSRIELKVNKKFWIQEIVFYYAGKQNFSGSYFKTDMAQPKLVVTYGEMKKRWQDKDGLADVSRFVVLDDDKTELASVYEHYKLMDLRRRME